MYKNQPLKVEPFIAEYRDKIGRGVTSGDLGLQYIDKQLQDNQIYDIENELFRSKFEQTPSGANLDTIKKHYSIPSIPNSKLKELMMLDDWESIFP